ncbi:IclR family transcriptional regulator domain-containing protein [Ovoidimarina sediminis]|uniref:IclR family transcriptional regulator domain-containing protein n=1 Tax=Ovoidimarina sediminis TaxID=3079856 RepID=UPI0029063143|nr:IclR family transcriptional regulator C-terminal domain-containing protein [Rhodophyticola sp. MJ-SS7]MDU8944224.1 IclR family transcriptional regulator C-terminal domain-containing protein [Rhodophyticola sp. MJ-SS7]
MAEKVTEKNGASHPDRDGRQVTTGLMTAAPDREEDSEAGVNPRDYVSSLARGLEVLRAFNRTRRKMTLSEVASETGNTRAGARRILLTLVREGYAVADGKLFDLTPQVLELGYSVLSSKGVWDIARPFIDHLSEELRESVSAAVLDKYDVVYVSGAQYHRILSIGITVGARFPAASTATGRVLLAAEPPETWDAMIRKIPLTRMTERTVTDPVKFRRILEDVREKGWCLVDQELEIGLTSIAVPVYNRTGTLAGAINVGAPSIRMTPEAMVESILPMLQETVANISRAITR